jgi:hypothetical protein
MGMKSVPAIYELDDPDLIMIVGPVAQMVADDECVITGREDGAIIIRRDLLRSEPVPVCKVHDHRRCNCRRCQP